MPQEFSTLRVGSCWASASRIVSRKVNADAVAGYRDPATQVEAFAVADGIGDTLHAARAARAAVDTAVRSAVSAGPLAAVLAAQRGLPEGVGDCVLVVATPFADRTSRGYRVAWVGDCRAYRWDGGTLSRLTSDQTMAQYLRDHGEVPAARWEHVVTNSVRTTGVEQVGWNQVRAPHGLLLTTDGVHKVLSDQRMAALLSRAGTVQQRITRLVAAAAAEGGDNASAMLVEETICWPHTALDRDSPGSATGGHLDLACLAAA